MTSPFKSIPRPKIGRSVFDLSYEHKFTCDPGELIPCLLREMVPGDIMKFAVNLFLRFQPITAPIMHQVNAMIELFFVPYRLIWDDWEDFITGGLDGTEAPTLPTWGTATNGIGTLWDYFGFPTGITAGAGGAPIRFINYAYNFIYNNYYLDETQQTEIAATNNSVLKRNWEKDYFTSALPWEQRGTAPALPISGIIDIDGKDTDITFSIPGEGSPYSHVLQNELTATSNYALLGGSASSPGAARWDDPALEVDLAGASTFGVNDLRLAFQMQKLLERAALGGARYTEYLKAQYGVSNGDSRLQRPEWIGAMKVPVIFSEVLQTSEDGSTPQGNMAGHGITAGIKTLGTYRATEFGVVMGLFSVMPKPAYSQGVDRQWLKETRWDFFNPLLVNLGEQAVTHAEIYTSATPADNTSVFGYQGRYNEMRTSKNIISGDLRGTFDHWHFGRQFSSKPSLNSAFLQYDSRKDMFAAPSEDGLIVNVGNIIKAIRPLPVLPQPGLIDH